MNPDPANTVKSVSKPSLLQKLNPFKSRKTALEVLHEQEEAAFAAVAAGGEVTGDQKVKARRYADRKAREAVAEEKKPTILQTLSGALNGATALTANVMTLQAEVDALKKSLTVLAKERNDALTKLASVSAERAELIRNKSTVAETVAQLGFSLDKLPPQMNAFGSGTPDMVYATWKELTGAAKTAYYREHQAILDNYKGPTA